MDDTTELIRTIDQQLASLERLLTPLFRRSMPAVSQPPGKTPHSLVRNTERALFHRL